MKKFILALFLLLPKVGISQFQLSQFNNIKELPKEEIYIHNSNNFLLTGETLYFSIYCLDNQTFSPYSKIAYLEIINNENKSITKQKILLNSGIGHGNFFINTKIKTGTYKIVAYTQWMKNSQSYYTKNIFIVNPFSNKLKKDSTKTNIKEHINTPLKNTPNEKIILFKNLKSNYSKREEVKLNLTNEFSKLKGAFSVSIRSKNNFELPSNSTFEISQKTNTSIYLPELRGNIIHGKISSVNELAPISNIKLSLSTKTKDNPPLSAITNNKGEFYFNFTKLNTSKVYIQVLEKNNKDYKIELIRSPNYHLKLKHFPELFLNHEITNTINNRSIYSQIENAYYTIKMDSIINLDKKRSFLNDLKITYKLDDYKRFKTIKETFTEIIEGASFVRHKGEYKLNVINSNHSKSLKDLPTLLIIDGQVLQNHNELLDFDSRKIKSISIIKNKYFYGNAIYQGIVLIKTFKKYLYSGSINFQRFDINPIQPEKIYFFQNSKNIKNKRAPDFRTQLFWNQNINSMRNEITFFTSDVTGEFEINIQGYTNERKFINVKQTFLVK